MAEQAAYPPAAGEASLTSGDWVGARAAFEAALYREEAPAAREGLARALWWTDGPARAIARADACRLRISPRRRGGRGGARRAMDCSVPGHVR
jgi:hypothetical protein